MTREGRRRDPQVLEDIKPPSLATLAGIETVEKKIGRMSLNKSQIVSESSKNMKTGQSPFGTSKLPVKHLSPNAALDTTKLPPEVAKLASFKENKVRTTWEKRVKPLLARIC
jgi:hypothetical protein